MSMSPEWTLMMVFVFLLMASAGWRRTRIRKAVRDLPTAAQRQLGDAPEYLPPDVAEGPELRTYAAYHRRVTMIVKGIWAMGFLYMAYVVYLIIVQGGA